MDDLEELLVKLILDKRLAGRIDQVNKILELGDFSPCEERHASILHWAEQVSSLNSVVLTKLG